MEDLGLIILTGALVAAFGALFLGTFLEYTKMSKDEYTGTERADETNSFYSFLTKVFG